MIVVVIVGVGLLVLLIARQPSAGNGIIPTNPSAPSVLGDGGVYEKGFHLITVALTDPNAIQHAVGLPGSDGWGSGDIFGTDFANLRDDQKLYHMMSECSKFAQNLNTTPKDLRWLCYSVAVGIMPEMRQGTCCDFDPHVPLAKGGGHMSYLGDYRVSFNQNGVQRMGTMRKLPPPNVGEGADKYAVRVGIPMVTGGIHYNNGWEYR